MTSFLVYNTILEIGTTTLKALKHEDSKDI